MKIITLVSLLAFMIIVGCGSSNGNGGCDFDLNGISNGSNAQSANSEWACESSTGELFIFQAFDNGTGFSTGLGIFTIQQSGCRSIDFQSSMGNGEIFNINGSTSSGTLTFTQRFNETGETFNVGCLLVILLF